MLSSHSPGKAASVIVLQVVLRQHESARTRPDGPAKEPSKAAKQKLNRDPKSTILRSLVVIMVVPCRPWHHELVFITAIYTICNSFCNFMLLSRSYLPLVHSGTYGFTQWYFAGIARYIVRRDFLELSGILQDHVCTACGRRAKYVQCTDEMTSSQLGSLGQEGRQSQGSDRSGDGNLCVYRGTYWSISDG